MPSPIKKKPAWLQQAGLLATSFGDPLYLLKYQGGQAVDVEAEYERERSDETLDALAAAGFNLVRMPFFHGFGLEFEREEMERSRACIARVHARGLRAATRVSLGSLTPETLLNEEPEAQNWLQVNRKGLPPSSRAELPGLCVRPCYNAEGYLRYLERVCTQALDCGADMLSFEDLGYNLDPDTCHCPVCVAGFRAHLRERYGPQTEATRAAGLARFGHHQFAHVRPPVPAQGTPDSDAGRLSGPHLQEWEAFKVRTIASCLARLSRHIERKNPECAVEASLVQSSGEPLDERHGIDSAALLPWLDCLSMERPHRHAAAYASGESVSRARSFKLARAFDVTPCFGHAPQTEAQWEGSLAEHMACGGAGLGDLGLPSQGFWTTGQASLAESGPKGRITKAYLDFYLRFRAELFTQTRPLPFLAVLCETPRLPFRRFATMHGPWNVEQILLERGIPFDLLPADRLEELPRYRGVVLADAQGLSDAFAAKLRAYVASGGGLVATEETGACDEWLRIRKQPALAELFATNSGPEPRAQFGSGKAALVSRRVPQAGLEAEGDPEERVAMARGSDELLDAIRFVAGESPLSVVAESGRPWAEARRTASGALALHVLNRAPGTPMRGLEVSVYMEQAPREIQPLSPEHTYAPLQHGFDTERKRTTFRMEDAPAYVLFHLQT